MGEEESEWIGYKFKHLCQRQDILYQGMERRFW